ncbi:hypothetical protein WJX75_003732 [Coccomyxa subellipsoidea]|uniref:BZIP domain-containing protein n=1 Tax=Coccomyxa subellipsoidea TaxID=248742 RepID=A0ABR2YMF8_9CHLO
MDESSIMNIMEEQATSAGDQSDRPPAPNPKASRARLWRARRKNDLSIEQLEDARRKNRDRQKRFRDRKREQKREARGHLPVCNKQAALHLKALTRQTRCLSKNQAVERLLAAIQEPSPRLLLWRNFCLI